MSVAEISKHLGVSSDTVYRWIERYSMPAHRIGRLWKLKKSEIDEWVRSGGANEMSNSGQSPIRSRRK